MPKKWRPSVGGPENKTYFVEVKTPRLRVTKGGVPEPPPNFPPMDEVRTSDLDHPPIISYAQAVEKAQSEKEK